MCDIPCNLDLSEVNFSSTRLSEDTLNYLVNNLTTNIQKLSLRNLQSLRDQHIGALVVRCSKIKVLDLRHTEVGNNSLTSIMNQLKDTLEEVDVSLTGTVYVLGQLLPMYLTLVNLIPS